MTSKLLYAEYMKYVNILCRVGASKVRRWKIEGLLMVVVEVDFEFYNWTHYKWNESATVALVRLGGVFKRNIHNRIKIVIKVVIKNH